ncbi:DUF192 domain-containing protein [Roseobacter sinensis]|uniref:DUF192 domain-containing protein n=1 Tax=Roseobacter sinensis TaxID=2931391 RepID=A0ABT3BFQ2_9RHOB|nr:DUF192 domain-containing protein [Roseobacter sp. WL0113]MCV3272375.1 DUF192 domain-containing protein [Roseobacter sp. WL0113]
MRLWLAAWLCLAAQAVAAQECRTDTVYLKGEWGEARFAVEIADDDAERAQGLMHREHLPSSAGMLFVYEQPQRLSFWMRNTLIPLDLIFIDQTGRVKTVHHSAQPLDETPIPGGPDPLTHVLEINGGLARAMGIAEGTLVRHPTFSSETSEWPC